MSRGIGKLQREIIEALSIEPLTTRCLGLALSESFRAGSFAWTNSADHKFWPAAIVSTAAPGQIRAA